MDIRTNYFRRQIKTLTWAGVALYDFRNDAIKRPYKIYSGILTVIFGVGYILSEVAHIVLNLDDVAVVTMTMCHFFAHCSGMGKLFIFYNNRKSVRFCMERLERDAFLIDLERGARFEADVIANTVWNVNVQSAILGASIVVAIINNIATTLRNSSTERFDEVENVTKILALYPFPSTIPFVGTKKESPTYELMFIFQIISIMFFAATLWSADTIIVGLMMHIKAQFEILANSVQKFTERAQKMTFGFSEKNIRRLRSNVHFTRNIKKYLHQFIDHHQQVIQLATVMEELFSFLFLVQFSSSVLSICACLYQISLLNIDSPLLVTSAALSVANAFQLLMYSWNGNEVTLKSMEISVKAFQSEWIDLDDDIKKDLAIIIMRAQKPCVLTAGKFQTLSLETYTNILRGSFSYFMVLRKVKEGF